MLFQKQLQRNLVLSNYNSRNIKSLPEIPEGFFYLTSFNE